MYKISHCISFWIQNTVEMSLDTSTVRWRVEKWPTLLIVGRRWLNKVRWHLELGAHLRNGNLCTQIHSTKYLIEHPKVLIFVMHKCPALVTLFQPFGQCTLEVRCMYLRLFMSDDRYFCNSWATYEQLIKVWS